MSPEHVSSAVESTGLQTGQHLCSLYQNEEEHRALLTPFLREGLQKGEKVLYFQHAHTPEAVRDYLRSDGLDLEPYLARGQLAFLNTSSVYLREGDFDPDRMVALLQAETEKALAEGYSALRVTGEMTWALGKAPGSDRLLEYEAKLNRFFTGSRCLALCQYDRRRFSPAVLLGVLQTHPIAVVGTTLYYNNFYFVPPEDFLGEDVPSALLRQYLKNLAERRRLDEELHRSHDQLEQRVEVRTRELSLANQALQAEIAARQRALESLRVAEEKFRRLLEAAPDAIVVVDRAGRVVLVNAQAETLFGYHREQLLGQKLNCLIPERFRAQHARGCQRFFAEGLARPMSGGYEHYALRKDGTEFPIEVSLSPLETEEGRVMTSIIRDISERKQAQEALRSSETSLARAQRVAHVGSWDWDIVMNELRWSDEIYRIFGLTPRESGATYEAFRASVHPDDREFVKKSVDEALYERKPYRIDHRIVLPDGTERVVHEQAAVTFDDEGRTVRMVGTVQDITERRKLEEQLRQAQKMEAVGRLAGGVAHDFNNLLGVVLGYSDLLLETTRPDDPARPRLEEIKKAAERATTLTRQLLAFSRRQVLQPQVLSINTVVADTEKMLRRLIGEDIALVCALDPSLGRVKADPTQLQQVIINLAINARDAMPMGGKLTIETRNVELDEDYARRHLAGEPGTYVVLAVSDTGDGMDKETQAHIFEPFFTTKEKEEGTGLGLATVYGIVKQSNGYIWVYSEPGKGATFKIYLPRAEEAVEAGVLPEPIVQVHETREKPRTVLVAEDEASLRSLLCQMLELLGYRVLEAADSSEAIRLAKEHLGGIDLLLTDVVMPGMSGPQLAEQLTALRPEVKVLYMSGYTDDAVVRHGVLERGTAFLEKPFTRERLQQKLREVFEPRRGG